MSNKGKVMAQRRSRKSRQPASLWQRVQAWRPQWRFGPVRRDVAGLFLIVLAGLTALGLSRISSGAVLSWWAMALQRTFGWGAYPVALGLGVWGLALLWKTLRERGFFGLAMVVGLELLLVVLLVASHAPIVLRSGADEAFQVAEEGRAGGYVGWALSLLLMEGLGSLVGSLVMLVALAVALLLILPLSWAEVKVWGYRQSRLIAAAYRRWQVSRQGKPVAPEPEEPPWWEVEPAQPEPAAKRRKPLRPREQRRPRPQEGDGGLPSLALLDPAVPHAYGDADVLRKTQIIEDTLDSFGVPVQVVEVNQGPTITQFGLDPGYIDRRLMDGEVRRQRVRVARIASLADDLALALAATSIRIEAPVPGKSVVGLEVPNEQVSLVSLRGVMESKAFTSLNSRLAIALGEDVAGQPVAVDLAMMPHLLIAGATGSGKSVCVNAIICSLLFSNGPDELKMLMVDPKMVELVGYNGIPHLLAPVVVDVEQVVGALAWVTRQMDDRYKLFNQSGVRNLEEYNRRATRRKGMDPIPTLVVLIDELADLMMVAPDEVERHICRLAQMGRATGIHLVVATQRPSVDVVTGLIKANFPARISFAVSSQVDSRVILDQVGADKLLGRGDMLFVSPEQPAPLRLQGCFVSDEEIDRLTGFWRDTIEEGEQVELFQPWAGLDAEPEPDSLLDRAIEVVEGRDRVSTSFIQRQLRIGFPRAARLMEQLEEEGIVGPDEGGGRGRAVFGGAIDLDEISERLPGVEPR